MKSKIYILLAITLLFSTSKAFSQGCVDDEPTSGDSATTPTIKIFGYAQPQFDYNFDGGDNENTFKFRRARAGVRGKIYDKFSYYFMIETSPFIGNNNGSTYLMDVFITYEADNWARISVGSYKQPFSLDVATPCHALPTIERSIVADQLVSPQRDFGIGVFGGNKYNKLNYAVAIMNGTGIGGSFPTDNNTKKDIMGRATYKVTDFLTVGGSFRYGFPRLNDNDSDRTTYGGEFVAEFDKLKFQGEYIHDTGAYQPGATGGCGGATFDLNDQSSDGAYILAMYDVNEKLQPVFKYEYFDQDTGRKDVPNLYQERMTVGFNYFFNDKIRFQLNYLANIETVINQDNDALLAQMQVKF